jgi:hypothetical protein
LFKKDLRRGQISSVGRKLLYENPPLIKKPFYLQEVKDSLKEVRADLDGRLASAESNLTEVQVKQI